MSIKNGLIPATKTFDQMIKDLIESDDSLWSKLENLFEFVELVGGDLYMDQISGNIRGCIPKELRERQMIVSIINYHRKEMIDVIESIEDRRNEF